jgi:hypothetical protein
MFTHSISGVDVLSTDMLERKGHIESRSVTQEQREWDGGMRQRGRDINIEKGERWRYM